MDLLINITEYQNPWFRKYEFQPEIVGPMNPNSSSGRELSVELPFNLQFNDYTKRDMKSNFVVQFINDFPLDVKNGLIIVKLRWEI